MTRLRDTAHLAFGVYDWDGSVLYIGLHDSEADCWKVFLGWPDEAEIADAKARGLMVSAVMCVRQPSEVKA